jgi:hypothetical protein
LALALPPRALPGSGRLPNPAPLPAKVSLDNLPPVGMQGTIGALGSPGSCISWSFAYGLGSSQRPVTPDGTLRWAPRERSNLIGPAFLYALVPSQEGKLRPTGLSEGYLAQLVAVRAPRWWLPSPARCSRTSARCPWTGASSLPRVGAPRHRASRVDMECGSSATTTLWEIPLPPGNHGASCPSPALAAPRPYSGRSRLGSRMPRRPPKPVDSRLFPQAPTRPRRNLASTILWISSVPPPMRAWRATW